VRFAGACHDGGAGLHAVPERVVHGFVELAAASEQRRYAVGLLRRKRTCSRTFIATAGLIMPSVTCADSRAVSRRMPRAARGLTRHFVKRVRERAAGF
jgi:hypothetical protein